MLSVGLMGLGCSSSSVWSRLAVSAIEEDLSSSLQLFSEEELLPEGRVVA
jgi:hypothetical protein